MSDPIEINLENVRALWKATDQFLSEWKEEGNLQIPELIKTMTQSLNWDEKTVRDNDPLIRYHVRHHPDWHVTRGAHGGIMRTSDKQKKEAAKQAKDVAKQIMAQALEAKALAAASGS
jgi:hypothetical protein